MNDGSVPYAGELAASYISRRTVQVRRWFPSGVNAEGSVPAFRAAVVIPCLDEYPGIAGTLRLLETSCVASGFPVRAVCVVNNRESHPLSVKENNLRTLEMLYSWQRRGTPQNPDVFSLDVIDACSSGRTIPEGQGVGFARKIGADYAVGLMRGSPDGVIACLDADTSVSPVYASALGLFADAACARVFSAAVLSFFHSGAPTPEAERAVRQYERYLRGHSRLLHAAGSPYYPTALGSAIVCSVSAYAACGGMNSRCAGEDFYFLQSLVKTGRVGQLRNSGGQAAWCGTEDGEENPADAALVFPSARMSERVPFGTGTKIRDVSAGKDSAALFPAVYYELLGRWIAVSETMCLKACAAGSPLTDEYFRRTENLLPPVSRKLALFLERESFFSVWERLYANNYANAGRLCRAFHCWFDGLKTIRFFHFLERQP